MTTLVCIPYFGCPELVERAVRSVLDQTHRDLQLVVIGDGEPPPVRSRDTRLEVFTLSENRGPYFAQSVALAASPHGWYAPVGADDWIEPDHLETLLATGGTAVVPGVVWFHSNGSVKEHAGLYEVGAFTTQRLREIGGYNPDERIGQDTLMMRILRDVGGLTETTKPTYHRVKRPGSLTTAPETGFGSKARNDMRARNRHVFAAVHKRRRRPDLVRAYRESVVPAQIRDEVSEQALRLSAYLGQAVAA